MEQELVSHPEGFASIPDRLMTFIMNQIERNSLKIKNSFPITSHRAQEQKFNRFTIGVLDTNYVNY